jgi:plasmid stabilization system protein ParE
MKRLRWSLAAAADLDEVATYLHLHHPYLAQATMSAHLRIRKALEAVSRVRP